MPHKRAKRSIRLANSAAQGLDNPPTAADSLLPITTTSADGKETAASEATEGKTRSNKRRKAGGAGGGQQQDLSGVSKAAYRVINAVALRDEYHASKKRKLEEEQKGKNPNQQKQKPALAPLPHESLSSFNRRVEQEMRSTVRSAIKDAGAAAQKKKDRKKKAKKADEEDEEAELEEEQQGAKTGAQKKPKPTPEESIDPFAPARLQQQAAARNRSGKTEFDTAPLRRRVDDVVQAPPTLVPAARKGLLAKVMGPGGSASAGVSSEGTSTGAFRLKGAEEPLGRSRLPVDPAMKALMDAERQRAVKMYRELKEKKEQDKDRLRSG
ncbi:hypothetical protein JCM11641_004534 [Rhodosporidiobolus odoratus]